MWLKTSNVYFLLTQYHIEHLVHYYTWISLFDHSVLMFRASWWPSGLICIPHNHNVHSLSHLHILSLSLLILSLFLYTASSSFFKKDFSDHDPVNSRLESWSWKDKHHSQVWTDNELQHSLKLETLIPVGDFYIFYNVCDCFNDLVILCICNVISMRSPR